MFQPEVESVYAKNSFFASSAVYTFTLDGAEDMFRGAKSSWRERKGRSRGTREGNARTWWAPIKERCQRRRTSARHECVRTERKNKGLTW